MIIVKNVHKRFGSQVVLNGMNLIIEPGTTTAIVGPSGVGKSVLLKLIMGIMQPDSGEISVFGEKISTMTSEADKNRVRESLGVLFQSAALLDSITIYDNVAFPLIERGKTPSKEIHDRVWYMLEALSLEPYAQCIPQEIPMGIRKRAGMARALITKPKVLLFDEPNTGLDPLVGQEVYDLIRECKSRWGFTGVVISHELPEVFQVSERVAMILGGKIILEGTPNDFIHSENPAVIQFMKGLTHGPISIN